MRGQGGGDAVGGLGVENFRLVPFRSSVVSVDYKTATSSLTVVVVSSTSEKRIDRCKRESAAQQQRFKPHYNSLQLEDGIAAAAKYLSKTCRSFTCPCRKFQPVRRGRRCRPGSTGCSRSRSGPPIARPRSFRTLGKTKQRFGAIGARWCFVATWSRPTSPKEGRKVLLLYPRHRPRLACCGPADHEKKKQRSNGKTNESREGGGGEKRNRNRPP